MEEPRYRIREDEQGWFILDTLTGQDHLRPGGPGDNTCTWRSRRDAQDAADYFNTRAEGQPYFMWLRQHGLD